MKEYFVNTYNRVEVNFVKGQGTWLFDQTGGAYLDFVAGIAVNSIGHSHPAMVDAITKQASKVQHISNLYWNEEQTKLAKKLVNLSDHQGVFFCNSGTEAVEGAIKTAKKFGGIKKKIICFNQSFHGRTLGALSVTAQKKYQEAFGLHLDDILIGEFNDIDSFLELAKEDVCAVIVEPVQGEGGIKPAKYEFLSVIKETCDALDILLIFDEVQCGAGRLGTFFAYESYNIIPDIVCMAKGLGGGMPIGAILVNEKANVLKAGDHGSTFGGNPLVCSAANAVINITSEQKFLGEVKEKSKYLLKQLDLLMLSYPQILEVRGYGLMLGIEFDQPIKEIIQASFENNLLLIGAGTNTVRLVPPLTVSYEEIDLFIEKFKVALS